MINMATRLPFGRRGKPTAKAEFSRQFKTGQTFKKGNGTAKTVRLTPPKYVPVGSGITHAHIAQRRRGYFGQGIF